MTDRMQTLVNIAYAYARWQANTGMPQTQTDFWDTLSADERFAVFVGNMNYQVENGGWSQWWSNGYGQPEVVAYLKRHLPGIGPAGAEAAKLLTQFVRLIGDGDELNDDDWEAEDALCKGYYAIDKQLLAEAEAYLTRQTPEREAPPNSLSISAYLHCGKCLAECPSGQSPQSWGQLEVGWTRIGLQVWCKRHNCNVMHIDFEGHTHPANTTCPAAPAQTGGVK